MKHLYFMLLFILAGASLGAQEYELGNVSIAELEEKVSPIDSSAPAAYLFKKGHVYFRSGLLVTETECRIKIYNKDGYEYANQEIVYLRGVTGMKADFSEARTYNLVNGKIEITKLDYEGKFKEKGEHTTHKSITLPNVREGSVIEYKCKTSTPYFGAISDWEFQYSIPANYVEYTTTTPLDLLYNSFVAGYVDVQKTVPREQYDRSGNFKERVITYTARNVRPFKEEPYVNNIENYRSKLKQELIAYHNGFGIQLFSTDWLTISKKVFEDKSFGAELSYKSYFKKELETLIAPLVTEEEKMKAVFAFVQSRMSWNNIAGYFCQKGVRKAYEEKTGNVADINLMLTSMLQQAGLEAYPVLVSTRENGLPLYPSFAAYDYVIAGVRIGEKVLLLDATSKFTAPDILPIRVINGFGRILKNDGASEDITLEPAKNAKNVVNIVASLAQDGTLTGRIKDQSLDNFAYITREEYAVEGSENFLNNLHDRYNGIEISNYAVAGEADTSKPLVQEYSFVHKSVVDVIGDKIYFSPMLFFSDAENPFKLEERLYPMDFVFPFQKKFLVNIDLPQSYSVESIPNSVLLLLEGNIGQFKYTIGQTGQTIQLNVIFELNYASLSQEYYTNMKDFFQKMVEKQNEKIVLKKA